MMYRSDEVKNSLKIEEVIQAYTGEVLTNNHMRCPFHNEKTASFFVNTKKQYFKCFGCGAGGDVITFVRKYFGIEFKDALSKLCADFGLSASEKSPSEIIAENESIRKRKAFKAWEKAAFTNMCKAYHVGKAYLKEQNKVFVFNWLSDEYLYIINHIDLIGLYLDLICENPMQFYKDYGEEGNIIARNIIAGCGG